jgi:hypothetical protein
MKRCKWIFIKLSLGFLGFFVISAEAQINNSLYFMPGVPQSNRVNPAYQPHCSFYLGLPLLSPVRVETSSSAFAYGDVIYPHPKEDSLITFLHPLGNKQAFIDLLEPVNYVVSDLGTSLVSAGFNTNVGFFSMDVTTRVDGGIYYPGDMARLILSGTEEGETYQFDGGALDLSAFDEISAGWTAKILHNLQVGVRGKLLFGVGNLTTTKSNFELTTSEDIWNIRSDMMFNASLPFAEVQYDEDGNVEDIVLKEELENFNPWKLPKYMFNGRNLGMGVDLGVTYRPIHELMLSASVLDIGYIRWKDEVHEVTYNTEFDYKGLEINPFEIPEGVTFGEHLDSLVSETLDSLSSFLVFNPGKYYSHRLNTKLYLGASYHVTPKISFGLLSRTDFLKDRISQQFTASANLTTGRMLNFTMSYSYINAYFKNIGAGVSLNLGPFNMYLISDNALNVLFWPQETKSVNLWFGMNLVFGYKKVMANLYQDKPLVY